MARKLLIGLGLVVAVLAVMVVALIAFVDVNRFKPRIEQAVKDRLNRQLAISGDLTLTVFPRLGVALPKTTLSEPGSTATFASLDGARVSLALMPLLGGRIEAGKVSVYGLTATIERRADGSTNIDDLVAAGAKAPQAAEARPSTAEARAFEIGGVELANANLTYRDVAAKNTVMLSRLNLNTGPLAPTSRTPMDLSTHFSATQPELQGELKARGELDIDLARRAFGGTGIDAMLKATLDKRAVEVSGKAAELRFDAASGALSVGGLDASAKGAIGVVQLDAARVEAPALAWHPQERRLSVGGLRVSARGGLDAAGKPDVPARTFEASLAAPKIEVTEATASGEHVTVHIKLSGAQQADVRLSLEGLAGSAAALKIDRLSLNASMQQLIEKDRTRKIVAVIASPATASLDAQTLTLSKLAGDIIMEDPALPQQAVKLPVTGAFSFDARKERVGARVSTRFDETTLSGQLDVRGFAPARLSFEASADKLDLDRYFPPAKPRPGNEGTDPQEDPQVDLSALKGLNLAGEARVGQLKARGIRVQNALVVLRAANGRLAVTPLNASLYGGSVTAHASAQAEGNRIALDAAFMGVDIEPLMKDALGRDLLAGRGNVKFDLATAGGTVGGLKRGLNGSGVVTLRDGAIKGIDVAQLLRGARKYLSGGQTQSQTGSSAEKTDFSEMTASFAVKDGVARSDDLDLKSALIRVRGAGHVDIASASLDYTVRATVIDNPKGQDLIDFSLLQGVTVPVKLSGPLDRIAYSVEWGAVARDALRSNTTGRVRELLRVPPDDKSKPPGERATDVLKGLFGR